jgi:serine/threonine protein kinase
MDKLLGTNEENIVDENNYSHISNTNNVLSDDEIIVDEIIYSGLVLKREYVLLKKIGFGNNASVWMAYQISTKNFLAIKIQDYQCYHDGCREVVIIKKINSYRKKTNRNTYCIEMLDYFVYEYSDNVKFVCSVYELYAGSINMVLFTGKYKYGLPIPTVKRITRQLLTALTVLHEELKIIHTDIKPENILFKGIPDYHAKIMEIFINSSFQQKCDKLLSQFSDNPQYIDEELEKLAFESVRDINSYQSVIIGDEEFIPDDEDFDENNIDEDDDICDNDDDSELSEDKSVIFNERKQSVDDVIENLSYMKLHDLENEGNYDFESVLNNRPNTKDFKEVIKDEYIINCEIVLTDFGNSYFYEKRTWNEIQDRRYRAPEIILDLHYGYACDIWSVSCVVFELLTGFTLFEPDDFPLNRDIHHLFLMEKTLGPIPIHMKKSSNRSRFLFDKTRNYHINNVMPFDPSPLKERLVKQFLFNEKEADEIYDFLLCGLIYEPSERLTAREMLEHPWLKDD